MTDEETLGGRRRTAPVSFDATRTPKSTCWPACRLGESEAGALRPPQARREGEAGEGNGDGVKRRGWCSERLRLTGREWERVELVGEL